jgi:hypothetical protein
LGRVIVLANEEAQHFYRKLDYKEKGSIVFDNTPHEQSMEMFMLITTIILE